MGRHDMAHITGDVTVRLTRGEETYRPLNSAECVVLPQGKYARVDSEKVLCRL